MDRPFQRKDERRGGRSAAALEDAKRKCFGEVPGACAAPAGEASCAASRGRKSATQARLAFGGDRKAPQLVVACAAEPAEQRMAARRSATPAPPPTAHRAARGRAPRRAGRGRCRRGKRGRVRQMRRREPDDALAGPRKRGERRQHELQLADARCAGPEARSAPRRASRRREARGRAHRSRWARRGPWQTAVRRARLDADRECGPVPPWLYHQS